MRQYDFFHFYSFGSLLGGFDTVNATARLGVRTILLNEAILFSLYPFGLLV